MPISAKFVLGADTNLADIGILRQHTTCLFSPPPHSPPLERFRYICRDTCNTPKTCGYISRMIHRDAINRPSASEVMCSSTGVCGEGQEAEGKINMLCVGEECQYQPNFCQRLTQSTESFEGRWRRRRGEKYVVCWRGM